MNRIPKNVELEMDEAVAEIPLSVMHRLQRRQDVQVRTSRVASRHSEFIKRSFRQSSKIAVYKMAGVV
jgi:hypothetical protein